MCVYCSLIYRNFPYRFAYICGPGFIGFKSIALQHRFTAAVICVDIMRNEARLKASPAAQTISVGLETISGAAVSAKVTFREPSHSMLSRLIACWNWLLPCGCLPSGNNPHVRVYSSREQWVHTILQLIFRKTTTCPQRLSAFEGNIPRFFRSYLCEKVHLHILPQQSLPPKQCGQSPVLLRAPARAGPP